KESKKNLVDCTNKFEEENKIFKKELKEFENKKNKALENNDFQELQNILDDEEFNIITPYNRKIRDTFNAFRSQGLKYIEQLPSNTGKNKIRSSLKNEMKKAEDIQKEFSKKKFDIINSHIDQNEKELKIFEIEAEEYRLIQESNFSHDAYKNFVKYYKKHEETNKLLNNLLINFSKKRDNLKSLNKTKITTKEKEDIKSAFKENLNSFLQESENIANKIFKEREDFLNNESRKIEEENQKISDNQDKCITVLQKKLKEINDKKQQ
ncbi:MAG: hypothetical protein LBT82_04450, partial [Oscillospiraceae bacterium]|nr:hypothetical protein [Oscillospiraceae bacterium]